MAVVGFMAQLTSAGHGEVLPFVQVLQRHEHGLSNVLAAELPYALALRQHLPHCCDISAPSFSPYPPVHLGQCILAAEDKFGCLCVEVQTDSPVAPPPGGGIGRFTACWSLSAYRSDAVP